MFPVGNIRLLEKLPWMRIKKKNEIKINVKFFREDIKIF